MLYNLFMEAQNNLKIYRNLDYEVLPLSIAAF